MSKGSLFVSAPPKDTSIAEPGKAAQPAATPAAPPGQQWLSVKDALERAQKLLDAGRTKQAEVLLRNIVKARPQRADARNLLGVVLHRLDQRDEAMKTVREAIGLNPNNPNFYCNLGEMERQAGHLDAAEAALSR